MVAAIAIALVAAAVGAVIGRASKSTHQPSAATPPPSTTVTAPSTAAPSSTSTTAEAPTATAAPSTVASAVPLTHSAGAGAFAGRWRVHVTLLVVDPSGFAVLNWRTYRTCGQDPPPCDIFNGNGIYDGGNATMQVAATSSTTADGTVLSTSVPGSVPVGPFTAHIDPTKDLLYLSLPLFTGYPLCGPTADALPVAQQVAQGINCGA